MADQTADQTLKSSDIDFSIDTPFPNKTHHHYNAKFSERGSFYTLFNKLYQRVHTEHITSRRQSGASMGDMSRAMPPMPQMPMPRNRGHWPQSTMEKQFLRTCGIRNVKLYYYRDPSGQIDNNRTLRAMFWLLTGCKFNRNDTLSAYFSILNVFTYPEFQKIASKLPRLVGIRFQPTAFTDLTWPVESIPYFDEPLSCDRQMIALAMHILLFEYKNYEQFVANVQSVNAGVATFPNISAYCSAFKTNGLHHEMVTFMKCNLNIPLWKHVYDCLLEKAVAARNKKTEQLLRLCGEKLPKIVACKRRIIQPD